MRTVEEIRAEMADAAQATNLAAAAGVQDAVIRNVSWYQALAWVLQEPWNGSDA